MVSGDGVVGPSEIQHHVPVLADAVARIAAVQPGEVWVDCTLGFGGHSRLLLKDGARVIGLDQDEDARLRAARTLEGFGQRVQIVEGNFAELTKLLDALGIGRVDGILADVGVSSYQLDQAHRGFSFRLTGPLDMRMNQRQADTAETVLRRLEVPELIQVLREYGEEPFAKPIARRIHAWLKTTDAPTTAELAECIASALPARVRAKRNHHPATRTFQAIRIVVNDELGALRRLLADGPLRLNPGGRILVISFHSLEDRMVKRRFNDLAGRTPMQAPRRGLPPPTVSKPEFELLSKRAIKATQEECGLNPRARSARLRGLRRLEAAA
ncbi:MAG: 16S rRNA (cytosine(1402)-N(4))-methyltransferase RsmH [Myxococcota bacterium]|nr:16S rRNA (cytosine(1402)-N(4))-methyltransferase RsmH [Myxococcota bacterium]